MNKSLKYQGQTDTNVNSSKVNSFYVYKETTESYIKNKTLKNIIKSKQCITYTRAS